MGSLGSTEQTVIILKKKKNVVQKRAFTLPNVYIYYMVLYLIALENVYNIS